MKRCKQCNLDFRDDMRFCLSCGRVLEQYSIPGYASQPAPIDRETSIRCPLCQAFVRSDSPVCPQCGADLAKKGATLTPSQNDLAPTQPIQAHEWYSGPEPYRRSTPPPTNPRNDRPLTAATSSNRNEKTLPSLPGLQSYGGANDQRSFFRWWHGVILLVFLLIFAGGLGAAGWWWLSRDSVAQIGTRTATDTQTTAPPSTSALPASGSTTHLEDASSSSADDTLKDLQRRRLSSGPSNTQKLRVELEAAEQKYPKDYRFPYERAKLSITGVISHHEAFEAIFVAARKAIENGEAEQMLNNLIADKDGDFYKMSRGHSEWVRIEEALKNKDKNALGSQHD